MDIDFFPKLFDDNEFKVNKDDSYPTVDNDNSENYIQTLWETNRFIPFTGNTAKLRRASDVAAIMRMLESKSVELAFAIHVDAQMKGTVQLLSIGSGGETQLNGAPIAAGVIKFKSKKVYLVHNHPSGNLTPSRQDIQVTSSIREGLSPMGVEVEHIIIDTYKDEFTLIDRFDQVTTTRYTSVASKKPITLHHFGAHTILKKPTYKISSSKDVYSFIQQQRFSAFPKIGMLVLSRSNEIIANFLINNKELEYNDIVAKASTTVVGASLIFYSNIDLTPKVNDLSTKLKKLGITILDLIITKSNGAEIQEFYKSIADEGLLNEHYEKYGTNQEVSLLDVNGKTILSSDSWNNLSQEQQEKLKGTITQEISDPHTGGKFQVDYNLAEPLQIILNSGFATGQSDSGTISDHPGYRYVEDSKTGKYHKGDCIPSGSCAYLTFWKPEAKGIEELGRRINTQPQIDTIRFFALKNGFVCQDTKVFYQPSIRLSLPYTNDGQSHQEILKQASEITNQNYPDLYDRDFWKWLDLRDEMYLPRVIEQHGGEKKYTDKQVIQLWANLAKGLEQSQKQNITIMEKEPEKREFEKIDYNKYKKNISLPDFLIQNFGFYPDKGSSSHYPKLKNDNTGEVLVIKKNPEGCYTYFNVHDDRVKGCSILDFMQDRLSKDDSAGRRPSLITVAQTLDGYLRSGKVVQPDDSKFYIASSIWNPETNYKDVKQLRPIVSNEFLIGRGFSMDTLENPLFKGVFFERDYNKDGNVFTNTAIKLYNLTGLSGLSQRNENFKGCLGNRFDSLACSIPNKEKSYTKIFVGESFLDCVAHFEINSNTLKNESVAYFSSEGAITSGQIVLLDKFIERNNPKELATIFDRDLAGIVYDLKLLSELKSNANSIEMTLHEDKQNKQIFLYLSDKTENKEKFVSTIMERFSPVNFHDLADSPGVEVTSLSNDSNRVSIQVTIPREYEFALRSTNIINELRFEGKEITIEKSFSNDFNDDLKAIKSERGIDKKIDLIKDQYMGQNRTNSNNIELSI